MSDAAHERSITGEDLLAMGDIGPCELIDGRIVAMTPTGGEHGRIESLLARQLGNFVDEQRRGWVISGEVGIYTHKNPDRVRGADVVFVAKTQAARIPEGFLQFPPELVVEIISPSDRWQDIQEKIAEYFSIGVRRVWIVQPQKRQILVYSTSTEVEVYGIGKLLQADLSLHGFELAVAEVFASA